MKQIITIAVLVFLFACSKRPHREEGESASLVLALGQSALAMQQVDSADVVFRKPGTSETSKAKFVKRGANLAAPLTSLTPGTWNADVELYTRAVNGQSKQYKLVKSIHITEDRARVELPGPGSSPANGWLKRHVKATAGNEVVVIVPDDVYDPYFEVRAKTAHQYMVGIQREAINVNYVVSRKTWACANACFNARGQLIDSNHFMPFTQTLLSSPWTRNEISIGVVNAQQEMILVYDRTWLQ